MEGNECYKFSTIRNYVMRTGALPIQTIVDIGANVGDMSALMHEFFPNATIQAIEVVPTLFNHLSQRFKNHPQIHVHGMALTAANKFADDLGTQPLEMPRRLQVLEGLPAGGPGWRGGSTLTSDDCIDFDKTSYAPRSLRFPCVSLDEAVERFSSNGVVDLVKFDCEGCEKLSNRMCT